MPVVTDPCNPSPCGPNTNCERDGICTCLPEYIGDPYRGCRPECTMNTDCAPTKACINNKCIEPCRGTCGQSANCDVVNHIPTCSCPVGFEGDPFVACRPIPPKKGTLEATWEVIHRVLMSLYDCYSKCTAMQSIALWTEQLVQSGERGSGLLVSTKLYRQPTVLPARMRC